MLPAKYNSGNQSSTINFDGDFIRVYEVGIFDKAETFLLPGYYTDIYKKQISVADDDNSKCSVSKYIVVRENEDLMLVETYDSNKREFIYGYYTYNGNKLTELLPCIYSRGEVDYQLCSHLYNNSRPDVDTNIPVNADKLEQTFAVIIANEKYAETSLPNVPYASNDGAVFKEYCRKTLGIPNANIRFRENAPLNQIRYELKWLNDIATVYNGQAKIIFYYAGYGIPDETNNSSYLLPTDGTGNDPMSAYSLNELYSQLGELPAKQVTVFMDACFSGAKRDGNMLTAARSIAIKAKSGTPKGNMVVFSAAQGDETAYQYNKKKHGMFTYFLLKKLQETRGEATLAELAT